MAEDNKADKEKLKSGFQRLMQKIGKTIEDIASLEVTTFTGDFTFKANQVIRSDVNKFEINSVLKGIAIENQTNIKLVAYTIISLDADVSTIVKSDLSESDTELLKLHTEMMKSSREARKATINMVTGMIKG